MSEVIKSKKPSLLFRGLINGQVVALAPEPFALKLNASNISLPPFEQWDLNTDSGFHERCFICGEIGEYFGALSEEFFEWDEELAAWAVSPLKKNVYLIEGDSALAPIVVLYGSDMGGIPESDISDVLAAMICTHWEPGKCTTEEVLECLKEKSDWAAFPEWMKTIALASMNASREASSALWDVIEARYPVAW